MRRSLTALAATATAPIVILALAAAPAQAAQGTANFRNAKGMDITLTDPLDGHCYKLADPQEEGAAWRSNDTDTDATLYYGADCAQDMLTVTLKSHRRLEPMWGHDTVMFPPHSVKFG